MNILITGSTGFLGKKITEVLKIHNINSLSRGRSTYNFDISTEVPIFKDVFDLVVHSAGKAHSIPKTNLEKNAFYDTNVLGTRNLLEGLLKVGVPKRFVFISSVSVYGLVVGENINEFSPLLAEDPYGKSKIEAETEVYNWCNEHNVIGTILRLPLIVDRDPPGNLGAMIKGIKNCYYFNIAGGAAQKSMVLASDVAQCILKVSEIGGIYNLTDGYNPTFNELSSTISLQLGRKFVPNMPLFFAKILAKIGDFIGDKFPLNSNKLSKIVAPLTFDDSKARKAFGWNPSPVLEGFKIEDND
jgi:nucleoside-diphosphate-sugar epimerase